MQTVAYEYRDPRLTSGKDPVIWGQQVDQVYQDFAPLRSQLQALFQICQTGNIDRLLLQHLADLGDSVAEICDRLNQLEALGVTVLVSNPESPDQISPLPSWPQLEALQAEQRRRRICQGHARNRLQRLPPPGRAPYGYRRGNDHYGLDRRTAPIVKDFFEHFLLYGSLRGAVRYLEASHGKKISVSTGRRWLTSPVYRGDLAYHDDQVVLNTHPAIVSREEAAQVDRLLHRNHRLSPRAASAPRSLAGLVACRECQSSMTISRVTTPRQQQEYLYLRPKTCPRSPRCAAIAYQQVLDCTVQHICSDLPQAIAELHQPEMGQLKQRLDTQIADKQRVLDQLPDLVARQILDQETADLRAYKLQTAIAAHQNQLAQLPPVNLKETAQAVSIPQFWQDLSEVERRFYFREFIRRVEIVRRDQIWSLKLIFNF